MIQNNVGEMIFSEHDVCDLVMQGHNVADLKHMIVDQSVNLEKVSMFLDHVPEFLSPSFWYVNMKSLIPQILNSSFNLSFIT
jgi:hypothetical protein